MVDDDDDDKFAFLFCNTSYKTQIGAADCYVFYTRMIDAKRERRTEKNRFTHTFKTKMFFFLLAMDIIKTSFEYCK